MLDVCTGRSSERRDAVVRCIARDAVFEHPFFVIRGQAAMFWMYEGWSLLNRRRVTYDATMSSALVGLLLHCLVSSPRTSVHGAR